MQSQNKSIQQIVQSAQSNQQIEVLWLYGSRAKGNSHKQSDFDLALAFKNPLHASDYPCDDIAYQWSKFSQNKISVVDINKIPSPLAVNIINEGKVLLSKNDLRLHSEMQRIWSLWELYRYEHTQQA